MLLGFGAETNIGALHREEISGAQHLHLRKVDNKNVRKVMGSYCEPVMDGSLLIQIVFETINWIKNNHGQLAGNLEV